MIPREVFDATLLQFFAPIRPYLDDPTVSEIMINGPSVIYVERAGKLEKTDARFTSSEALMAAVRNLAQYVGRVVSEERPILEGRFPDGSRVEALLPPIAMDGPLVSIRRFTKHTLTVARLLEMGSLSADAAAFLALLVGCKQNIVISGGTGSGKTSLLNVSSSFIAPEERVVVIEDSRELQLQRLHVLQLEAQPPDAAGRGAVSIRDLFRATLRMRPDRIVVGEIRGGEALDLVQAMTSGHGGCLTTVHASYPVDALSRLETMALMSEIGLPLFALRAQIASAVDAVVQASRLADGSRVVTHISEVLGHDPQGGYRLQDIFVRDYRGKTPDGNIISDLVPTGVIPRSLEAIRAQGLQLPAGMLAAFKAEPHV